MAIVPELCRTGHRDSNLPDKAAVTAATARCCRCSSTLPTSAPNVVTRTQPVQQQAHCTALDSVIEGRYKTLDGLL